MSLLIDILLTNFLLFKCPNYGRGRGGSDPILSVQTFFVHTSLGGGGQGILPHVQNFVVFFFEGSPKNKTHTGIIGLSNILPADTKNELKTSQSESLTKNSAKSSIMTSKSNI